MGERAWYLGGRAIALLLRAWALTLRLERRKPKGLPYPHVIAIWHGRIAGSIMANFDCGLATMASRSTDGALAAGVAEGLGLVAARGSSSRGGRLALDEMETLVRAGAPFAALTVDGPRGPWRKVKPGVVALALRLNIPIVPMTFSCRRPLMLHSWDRMVLPRPFTKVVVEWGEPWSPEKLGSDFEDTLEVIARGLDSLTAALDREVAGRELWPAA